MPRTEAVAQRDAGKPRKEATEEETGLKASNEGGMNKTCKYQIRAQEMCVKNMCN